MLGNYIKIAIRNLLKYRRFSLINIVGLSVGIASCVLIAIWVLDEVSFDSFHKDGDNLYRVIQDWTKGELIHEAVTVAPTGPALKRDFPEVLDFTRIRRVGTVVLKFNNKTFYENGGLYASNQFLNMFTFPLSKGNSKKALNNLNSIVISENLSKKYFGDSDPLGKIIKIQNQYEFIVTGVLNDIPLQSHLQFEYLIPFKLQKSLGVKIDEWSNSNTYTYVQLKPGTDIKLLNKKILNLSQKYNPQSAGLLFLQPLSDIHFQSDLKFDMAITSDVKYVYLFIVVGLLILIIACMNYINLTTALSGNRTKEISIRKIAGAGRKNLFLQFVLESAIVSILSLLIASILVEICSPVISSISAKDLSLASVDGIILIFGLSILLFVINLLVGIYPALFLSSMNPVLLLRNSFRLHGKRNNNFRRLFVISQFVISIMLIVCVIGIYSQLNYIERKDKGYNADNVICFSTQGDTKNKYDVFRNELLKNQNVLNVAASSSMLTWGRDVLTEQVNWPGKDEDDSVLINAVVVDHNFIDTLQMQIVKGRSFSKRYLSDMTNSYIINEKAAKLMGMELNIGKPLTLMGKTGNIIGIIKDYHFKSIHNEIKPIVLRIVPAAFNYIYLRINPENTSEVITYVESVWNKFESGYPFEYTFLNDSLYALYNSEKNLRKVFFIFTLLALSISCLGLYGMSIFITSQRTKEIGIRKAIGANMMNILKILLQDSIRSILIANLIAWPIAYIFLNKWLQGFAYRIPIGIWMFVFAGCLALLLAIIAVSVNTFKAASANPVEALKYE